MTVTEAEDEILAIFKEVWDATGYPVRYVDVPNKLVPDTEEGIDTPWARVRVDITDAGGQASLAGADGARQWEQFGIVYVQVFAPVGDGRTKVRQLAQTVVNAYREARPTGIWIRNPRMRDVQSEGGLFTQMNVIAEFSFNDVR